MSILDWFTSKSPEQAREDSQRYDQWAFPHGTPQKDAMLGLLAQFFPKEDKKLSLVTYLIVKEAYCGNFRTTASMEELSHSERLKLAMKALKKKLTGPQRKQIPMYLALILADAQVDESLQYPSTTQLQESAQQLQQEIDAL